MMFGPLTSPENAERVRLAFDWPPSWEEWGTSPEALAAQDAMASSLGLDDEG